MVIELNSTEVTETMICPKCGGSGRSRKWAGEDTKPIICPRCGGTGEILKEDI